MFLIYDTETTGLPKEDKASLTDFDNWPRLVQLAWQIHDEKGELVEIKNFIVKPDGFEIPYGAERVHGISTQRAIKEGEALEPVLREFNDALSRVKVVAGHNIEFDNNIVAVEFLRKQMQTTLMEKVIVDTKEASTSFCALPGGRGRKFKWPKLSELHIKLFHENFDSAHNASADVQATARCFFELIRLRVIRYADLKIEHSIIQDFILSHPNPIEAIGLNVETYNETEENIEVDEEQSGKMQSDHIIDEVLFAHLHVHTQFSVLDGLSDITKLVEKAVTDGMKAVAITDHGNMFGVKKFHEIALAKKIKPILGCEVYIARRGMHHKTTKQDGGGWHLVLLAKNRLGYNNLMKLVSVGWTEGYYYKPRIDKTFLKEHSEGLMALTACLSGEIPDKIVREGIEKAEEALKEYIDIFGDDLYLELQRHKSGNFEIDRRVYENQQFVNKELIKLGNKYNLKVLATNDVHFVDSEDADAHDRLICIGTGKDLDDPNRFHYTQQEWFKTQQEMKRLFADVPGAIENISEVINKVESYGLNHKPFMPEFEIPHEFSDANDYLRHLTYIGAEERYQEITVEVRERLAFELKTIKKMGFPDYFLIVWDFLEAARKMGVSVGPGRGSAAGSVVAYCLKITQIDPLKYNLLFERFLNPDRISMPDIDIDFDDDGRDKVLQWVSEKYGKKKVAHLITFGTMAAKSAIRDVARVQKLPLSEADRLAKFVPDGPKVSLKSALKEVPELKQALENGKAEISEVLKNAVTLEGSVRNTGTHACGIIIASDDLEKFVPVSTVKGSVLEYATQYDGKYVESIGLLKMDFLGLKTLSIIKEALENVKRSQGITLDIDNIPLDDKETYELYSRGETTGLFQFESDGMKKYLKDLKPTRFEDLIAMNALYRPGPMDYIPNFIRRKHGIEKIEYDLPVMEEILKETYGITVYQEQVMLLSRVMAGFTRGQSDSLRKGMGKKKKEEMEKLKNDFLKGCENNGLSNDKVLKVWKDWEAFANYAFNKSHATCYSYVSYQTAYLKAHYPAEFMAAVLSRNLNNIDKITFFTKETKRMGISVLGPDINESSFNFTVNKEGIVRFGLAAIKGVGRAAVEEIGKEREKYGPYKSVFDFAKRVNLKTVNKKSFEALAMAGAFETFPDTHRAQFFYRENDNNPTFIELVLKYAAKYQENKNSAQISLFGDDDGTFEMANPEMPVCESWTVQQQLAAEKEVTGFYISGHPLDDYRLPIKHLCNVEIATLRNNLAEFKDKDVRFAGMITNATQRTSKNGSPFGIFTVEDFTGSIDLRLFSEKFLKLKHFIVQGGFVLVKARIEGRYNDNSNLFVNVREFILLNEAMDKMVKKLSIVVDISLLNDDFIEGVYRIATENRGNCKLYFQLVEPENNKRLYLRSGMSGINPFDFLKEAESLENAQYVLQ